MISSYLFANEETWRRGITLSLASAVMQSLTAITIVGVAAVLLGATAKLMADTVNVIETVSYVLIVLLGARLAMGQGVWLLRRAQRPEGRTLPATPPAATPTDMDCDHTHDMSCNHHSEAAQAQNPAPAQAPERRR